MSILTTIKNNVSALLPPNSKLRVTKHHEANDLILDNCYIPFGIGLPYFGTVESIENYAPNCVIADGRQLLKSEYPIAWSIFGTIYNKDTDINTDSYFRIPNIEPGNTLIQRGSKDFQSNALAPVNKTYNLGENGGNAIHRLLSQESGTPQLSINIGYNAQSSSGTEGGREGIISNDLSSTPQIKVNIPATHAAQYHDIMSPYTVCNWIIRVK